jgi:3-keto-L-gulonate-6-phosphate decarboxylase
MNVSKISQIMCFCKINYSVQLVKDGRKRKLIFKDVKITDAGQIKCTTNADATEGELAVECM